MSNLSSVISRAEADYCHTAFVNHQTEQSAIHALSLPIEPHFKVMEKQPVWYRIMDQAISKHMVTSTLEALRDFAGIKDIALHHTRYEGDLCHEFQSRITIEGIPEWVLVVDVEQSLIEEIVFKLLGVSETDVDIMQDLTNEIANLIAGGFKTYLPCFTKLGLPSPINDEFNIKDHAATFPMWKIASSTPHGLLHVYTAPLMLKYD
jgi:hypothetical protein